MFDRVIAWFAWLNDAGMIVVNSEERNKSEIYDDGYLRFEHDKLYLSFGGKPVHKLSPTDFKIISRLLRAPGCPVPGRDIWQFARGHNEYNGASLRAHLTYLRHKLSPYGVNIVFKVGYGYILEVSSPPKIESGD